VGVIRV